MRSRQMTCLSPVTHRVLVSHEHSCLLAARSAPANENLDSMRYPVINYHHARDTTVTDTTAIYHAKRLQCRRYKRPESVIR